MLYVKQLSDGQFQIYENEKLISSFRPKKPETSINIKDTKYSYIDENWGKLKATHTYKLLNNGKIIANAEDANLEGTSLKIYFQNSNKEYKIKLQFFSTSRSEE